MSIARNNDARLILALLAAGADIEARSPTGWTALHVAAGFSRALVIAILARHGATVNTADNDGDTPLITAAAMGHTDTVHQLLANGANPRAASPKVGDDIFLCLRKRRLTSLPHQTGDTALHIAVRGGFANIVSYLLAAGASIAVHNNSGESPLDLVVLQMHPENIIGKPELQIIVKMMALHAPRQQETEL